VSRNVVNVDESRFDVTYFFIGYRYFGKCCDRNAILSVLYAVSSSRNCILRLQMLYLDVEEMLQRTRIES